MCGKSSLLSRRSVIRTGGAAGLGAAIGTRATASAQSTQVSRGDRRAIIEQRVESTPIVDTHEHLFDCPPAARRGALKHREQMNRAGFRRHVGVSQGKGRGEVRYV